jgi:hypothetical protein
MHRPIGGVESRNVVVGPLVIAQATAGWRECCRREGRKAVDNERTLRVLADHYPELQKASAVLAGELRVLYYQRAADILTSKYIQSSLDWETYQMALAALRSALAIPAPESDCDRAD